MNMIPSGFSFVVKRSEWHRGKSSVGSRLLRWDGKKCCVGFCMMALGFDPKELKMVPCAGSIENPVAQELEHKILGSELMPTQPHIYGTNDNEHLSDSEREDLLTQKFAAIGIAVTFID